MKRAIIVVDMTKDNVTGIFEKLCEPIIPVINKLTEIFRKNEFPVIFANDSFFEEDFIFKGKMPPHSLRYNEGSEVTDKLIVKDRDIVLPKRRFSAFFKTDLDMTLRTKGVEKVYICGITSTFCVLATAFDSFCNDFATVIVEDATTAHKIEFHEQVMNFYRKNPLQPYFEIQSSVEIIKELENV